MIHTIRRWHSPSSTIQKLHSRLLPPSPYDKVQQLSSALSRSKHSTSTTRTNTNPHADAHSRSRPQFKGGFLRQLIPFIRTLTSSVVFSCLSYHLISTNLVEASATRGPSMIPTFSATGDWILVDKRYWHGRGMRVGDIADFTLPSKPGYGLVKRITGMPGDFVIYDKHDSLTLPSSPHQEWECAAQGKNQARTTMIQIPQGHCWMIGDNLSESRDSRTFGPVPLALIRGKVIAKILPFRDAKWIENNLQPATELD